MSLTAEIHQTLLMKYEEEDKNIESTFVLNLFHLLLLKTRSIINVFWILKVLWRDVFSQSIINEFKILQVLCRDVLAKVL